MNKLLISAALVGSLSGCAELFPQTTAGFESGGILGALDGATGAIVARCANLDGEIVRVAVDGAAASGGFTATVEEIREARQAACAKITGGRLIVETVGLF